MKILVATGLYPPEIGGPATHARLLEKHLPKEQFEVEVIPFGSVRDRMSALRPFAYLRLLFRASKNAEVVYSLDSVGVGLLALLIAKVRKRPFILRFGGLFAWETAQQRYGISDPLTSFVTHPLKYPLWIKTLLAVETFVSKRAAEVVVPSEHFKKVVRSLGVPEERIKVLYSVFEPREIKEDRETLRKMFDYNDVVIASAGRLVVWKGFHALLDVAKALEESLERPVTLVIAGDGPELPALEAIAREKGLEGKVRLVGNQPQDTLLAAIKGADVFMLNTGYSGFAHQLLEVMNIGVPIVTTRVGVNPEILKDEESALLVGHNDVDALTKAAARIVTHDELRAQLVASAQNSVQAHSVEQMINKIGDIFLKYKEIDKNTKY